MEDRHDEAVAPEGRTGLNRRQLLQRFGIAGAAVAAGPSLLAACGGDNSSSGTATTAASGSGATTAASSGGGAATTAAGGGGDVGTRLKTALGITDGPELGGGKQWTMGAVLALSGNGSFYGKTMSRGIDLAVKHIAAAGGPTIKVDYKDHKSGDPQAGVNAITELGTSGVPAKLASYGDDILAMIPGTQQYKVFTFDGGGGTGITGQKEDYFYGCRAITPNDPYPGIFQWVKQVHPEIKSIGAAGWDLGATNNQAYQDAFEASSKAAGYTPNGLYELFAPNTSDFAQILPKIKANEPDILLVSIYGQDPGSFASQAATAGLTAIRIGFEFTPDGLNASKGTYDSDGYTFAYDYFDAKNPKSPLAKKFVEDFNADNGEDPDFYAANFYENALVMWEVMRRIWTTDPEAEITGEALDKALQENLTVVSVYGGDDSTIGTYTLDPKTHSVVKREMGVFEYKGGTVTPKAFFGIGGVDYKPA